jgi:hypothetical protein
VTHTLREELRVKAASRTPFAEEALVRVARDVCGALVWLESTGVTHGLVSLDTILLNDRAVKLCPPEMVHRQNPAPLLAPESLRAQELVSKGDIFRLGVVLICCAMLVEPACLFVDPGEPQKALFSKLLAELLASDRYSSRLKLIVHSCLKWEH